MRPMKMYASPRLSRGISLVEMLVSITIGLVILGAVLISYLGSGFSGRHSSAMAQMTENATVALGLMRGHIAMADYSAPTGMGATGIVKAYTGLAVFGCEDGAFTGDTTLALNALTTGANCGTGAGSDAIGMVYQADSTNAVMKDVSGTQTPTDCLGQALSLTGGIYLDDIRFFVQEGQLYCRGGGDLLNARPLVDGISTLQVSYGLGGTTAATARQVVQYLTADSIDAAAWARVMSVRLCVVVRSEGPVQDSTGTPYRDCSFSEQTPNDRYMYRAFTSTVMLNNRVGGI